MKALLDETLGNGVFNLGAQARELRDSFIALHGAKSLHAGETDFLGDSPSVGILRREAIAKSPMAEASSVCGLAQDTKLSFLVGGILDGERLRQAVQAWDRGQPPLKSLQSLGSPSA